MHATKEASIHAVEKDTKICMVGVRCIQQLYGRCMESKHQCMQLIRQPKSCAAVAQVTDHVWMAEFGGSTLCGKLPSMFPAGK